MADTAVARALVDELKVVLGAALVERVHNTKLLVIGAGGIGCELLKNLVLCDFQHIDVVDLDTIDVSNLNRQFLFRRHHVGMGKAEVAKEAVSTFNSSAKVTAYRGNVKSPEFGLEFFQKYNVVLNALDNDDARKHVNRLCLALGAPLLDSGSTGYNGQVQTLLCGVTECFECREKPRQRSFPVCTIRSTPDKPEHCIAWAKYLYDLLFGPDDEGNLLSDLKRVFESGEREETLEDEQKALELGRRVFSRMFDDDIAKAAELTDSWVTRQPPKSLSLKEASTLTGEWEKRVEELGQKAKDSSNRIALEQTKWSVAHCLDKFMEVFKVIFTRRKESIGTLCFDKDDVSAMDFVTAAANLRMHNFGIPMLSRWDVQSIAGAIIPAIASTNAIVAGMQVCQLLHFLKWRLGHEGKQQVEDKEKVKEEFLKSGVRFVWVKQFAAGNLILLPTMPETANPKCYVCGQKRAEVRLHSLKEWSLKTFISRVVKGALNCGEPLIEAEGRVLYDPEDEDDDSGAFNRSLNDWRISSKSYMTITDCRQGDFQLDLLVIEDPAIGDEIKHPELFELSASNLGEDTDVPTAKSQEPTKASDCASLEGKRIAESPERDRNGDTEGDASKRNGAAAPQPPQKSDDEVENLHESRKSLIKASRHRTEEDAEVAEVPNPKRQRRCNEE